MKKKLPLFIASVFVTLAPSCLFGQDLAVFSQFTLNPYQFNPSFAANNGYAEANVFYRKQWINIENAPELLAFNIQAPVGRNVSLGLLVQSHKTILLTTNQAMASFGYRVRFSQHHHVNFGLAAGIGMNNFDLEALANSNDPALADVVQKSNYFSSQFGINYQFKNLSIGFALPNLINAKSNSTTSFQDINFDPFNQKFGSVSYRVAAGDILLEPTVLFRAIDNQQYQWEGMLMATYKNLIWIGASYRDGYGLTGMLGIRFKNLVRVGYAYEYPTSSKQLAQASRGSHEIYLGARLGKRNREEEIFAQQHKRDSIRQAGKVKQEPEPIEEKEPVEEVAVVAPVEQQPVTEPEVVVTPPVKEVQPEIINTEEPVKETSYYLVVGVYQQQENAIRNLGHLKKEGYNAGVIYVKERDFYYVYLQHATDKTAVRKEWEKVRSQIKFVGAWIFTLQQK